MDSEKLGRILKLFHYLRTPILAQWQLGLLSFAFFQLAIAIARRPLIIIQANADMQSNRPVSHTNLPVLSKHQESYIFRALTSPTP